MSEPRPTSRFAGQTGYRVPRHPAPVDLHLDGNEGAVPPPDLLDALAARGPDAFRRYPDAAPLAARIAARLGLAAEQVMVTAGADEAIERLCRAVLAPGRALVLPVPSFEMIERYARIAGGEVVAVPWPGGAFPRAAVLDAIAPETALIAVVSPNNPTGAVASAEDLRALSAAAPQAVLLVDLAYGEFADEDLTPAALALPNAVVTRTFSKAWGLAGLRVGYAAGPAEIVGWMRAAGGPYAVASASLALAEALARTGRRRGRALRRARARRARAADGAAGAAGRAARAVAGQLRLRALPRRALRARRAGRAGDRGPPLRRATGAGGRAAHHLPGGRRGAGAAGARARRGAGAPGAALRPGRRAGRRLALVPRGDRADRRRLRRDDHARRGLARQGRGRLQQRLGPDARACSPRAAWSARSTRSPPPSRRSTTGRPTRPACARPSG